LKWDFVGVSNNDQETHISSIFPLFDLSTNEDSLLCTLAIHVILSL